MELDDVQAAVERAFERTSAGLRRWDDPFPHRNPPDDAYSRCDDPAKWEIINARVEAWIEALVELRRAEVEVVEDPAWRGRVPANVAPEAQRVRPVVSGGMAFVVARLQVGEVANGVALGVGEAPTFVEMFPDCGCDACDSGSADALDEIDEYLVSIVTGEFVRLDRRDHTITVLSAEHRGQRFRPDWFGRGQVDIDEVLTDPTGWQVERGNSWLGE